MRASTWQFGIGDLLWFMFGAAAFLSAFSPYNPLGGLTSCLLLAVFYWRNRAYDVLILHWLYAGVGLAAAAVVLGTWAAGIESPERLNVLWWTIQASCLTGTIVSYSIYLLALLAREA